MSEPEASRPHMLGYGILDADAGAGLLPWSWAAERISKSHNYWLATARPDGRPHVMPVWGIFLDDVFYFSTGQRSRKARNLAANPHCVVCTENADEAVIVEGVADEITDMSVLGPFIDAYKAKYDWQIEPEQEPLYFIRPRVVFAFIENAEDFPGSATRWRFRDE